jgi:ribonuclease P protein component
VSYETGRFRRADRVLLTRDFTRTLKAGKRRTSASFVVVIAPRVENPVGGPDEKPSHSRVTRRLGVTVSRQVGNSVIRNRIKRRIREWFRHARQELPTGSDIVVIARRTARGLSSGEVAVILDEMTQRQHGHLGAG